MGQEARGEKKLSQLTRYGTVVIAIIQGLALSFFIADMAVINKSMLSYVIIVISRPRDRFPDVDGRVDHGEGIGNGSPADLADRGRFPVGVTQVVEQVRMAWFARIVLVLVLMLALIVCIIGLDQGQRRISVHSKRIVGGACMGAGDPYPDEGKPVRRDPGDLCLGHFDLPQTMAKFIDHPFAQQLAVSLSGVGLKHDPLRDHDYCLCLFLYGRAI